MEFGTFNRLMNQIMWLETRPHFKEHVQVKWKMTDFAVRVMENGGNDALLAVLKEHGFTSKLSLKHLDLDSDEQHHSDHH